DKAAPADHPAAGEVAVVALVDDGQIDNGRVASLDVMVVSIPREWARAAGRGDGVARRAADRVGHCTAADSGVDAARDRIRFLRSRYEALDQRGHRVASE